MEIEKISKEYIKPYSPTPPHSKIYKLSLLDQMIPDMLTPLMFYFTGNISTAAAAYDHRHGISEFNNAVSETTEILKQSLSVSLTLFYPLAGRIMKNGWCIDCNDEGVVFIVAKTKCRLSDFLNDPDARANAYRHLPNEGSDHDSDSNLLPMMVQINYFDCGGMAIGLLFRHKVLDAATMTAFLKSWAATSREDCQVQLMTTPNCNMAAQSMFPQNETLMGQSESGLFSGMLKYFKKGKTVMRRYVFDASAISTLKAKLINEDIEANDNMGNGIYRPPTRVETVSAFIWRCFMVASIANNKAISAISHSVNLRRRVGPKSPVQENSFGNFIWLALACSINQNYTDTGLNQLVRKIRDATSKINVEFIETMTGSKGSLGYGRNVKETWDSIPKESDFLVMSSYCNFGLYTCADFGWGKPVWLNGCHAGSEGSEKSFPNFVWLVDTRDGAGIEAWVVLEDKYMAAFDGIKDLQILASVDPSPLQVPISTLL